MFAVLPVGTSFAQAPELSLGVDVLKLPTGLTGPGGRFMMAGRRSLTPRLHLAGEAGYFSIRKDSLRTDSEPFFGRTDNPYLDYRSEGGVAKVGLEWHDGHNVIFPNGHTFFGARLAASLFSDQGRWHGTEQTLASRRHFAWWLEAHVGTEFALAPRWAFQVVPSLRVMPGFEQPTDGTPVHNVPGFGSLKYNFPGFGKVNGGPKVVPALQFLLIYRWKAGRPMIPVGDFWPR
ncbi:MAG: hypothetical protein WBA12_02755 [Catalinimonas sp.]